MQAKKIDINRAGFEALGWREDDKGNRSSRLRLSHPNSTTYIFLGKKGAIRHGKGNSNSFNILRVVGMRGFQEVSRLLTTGPFAR